MNRFTIRSLMAFAVLAGIVLIGLKPIQAEFVCMDSTSRCNETWSGDFWIPVHDREIDLGIYGYEFFGAPVYWLVFVSELPAGSDISSPRDTRISWFNRPFERSDWIPELALRRMREEGYFNDRYELTFDNHRTLRIAMGNTRLYFNPFRFRNGKFEKGI